MEGRNYWLDLFTGTTWNEFLKNGGNISGFRENRWKTAQRVKPGDYFLCYLTGVSRWIGILEVISGPYRDDTPIWGDYAFPVRFKVKIVYALEPETAVPITELKKRLNIFENLEKPNSWTGYVRGSPLKWSVSDGEEVVKAVQYAQKNPMKRPFDPKKLEKKPPVLKSTKIGDVVIPEDEESDVPSISKNVTPRTEIQWVLLKLGNDMGFDVWVARNDRNREFNCNNFSDLPNIVNELPLQFDEATNKTIELMDVLWLKGNAIISVFEIESTTSIYSGLLRISDLISMQPDLNIPLYLVAPDEWRNKVIAEVNRPTFSRLSPPLNEICRYISFSELKKQINDAKSFIRHLKPEFLEDISESCETDEV
jgi:hypothetical protein